MGEAKKRGTLEQRKAESIVRQAAEEAAYAARIKHLRRDHRTTSRAASMLAIAAGLTLGRNRF